MNYEEKTITRRNVYSGRVIGVDEIDITLPNGRVSKREVVTHPGASVIIPLTEDGEIYMVRQYRKPVEEHCLELPAGKLDENEEPKTCAIRELKEETGLVAETIEHVISIYSSPGFSDEVLHIYLATGLKEGETCKDEDEFLSCEKYPIKTLVKMIMNHEIKDAKTVIGLLMAEKIYTGKL